MAVDFFLKLDGVDGESQDSKHKNEIQLESFNWGLTQQGTNMSGGGGGTGKVAVHDISVSKVVDKSSPSIWLFCATGKHIHTGTLTVRKAGENPLDYLKISLTDILISSVQQGGSGGGDQVGESVSLNFAKFQIEYTPQKSDGTGDAVIKMGYDVKANKKV